MKNKINVRQLPLAPNVCDQMLREVFKNERWSIAHVTMNPGAYSQLHEHRVMTEYYVITRGCGDLVVRNRLIKVHAGSVVQIPAGTPHQLMNNGVTSLEHLVVTTPPFTASDVFLKEERRELYSSHEPTRLPPVTDSIDGARIISYPFADCLISFAFGWVTNDATRRKEVHYHEKITEYIYVVEGDGVVEIDEEIIAVEAGDFLKVPPGLLHAIRNYSDQNLVVLCICTPHFDGDDVYYR